MADDRSGAPCNARNGTVRVSSVRVHAQTVLNSEIKDIHKDPGITGVNVD